MSGASDGRPVLLFDGVCNLCNASVQFVIDRDAQARVRFASLQSTVGAEIARRVGVEPTALSSLVLVEGARAHTGSTGALRLCRYLGWPWRGLTILLGVPRVLRDPLYRLVATNRYRWFGRSESCRLPTPELRTRFLDA